MAELKRTFVKGGMNLDLDERLVGQGLYREAINIRVSSSSEGNEGSLETVKGTVRVNPGDLSDKQDGAFGPRNDFGKTVGTAVDKTNDKAYHFIEEHVHVNNPLQELEGPFSNRDVSIKADAIYEYSPSGGAAFGDIDLVFNDVYEIRTVVDGIGEDNNGSYIQLPAGGLQDLDIREDMRIFQATQAVGTPFPISTLFTDGAALNGNFLDPNLQGIDAFYVDYVDRATDRVYVKDDQGVFALALAGPMQYAVFKSRRILNFDLARRYITGINVFDGLIFFTDGENEPKKINIHRSKVGTLSDNNASNPAWINDRRFFHTRLLLENVDNLFGFQGVSFWDFNGNIDNGTGGVIESHCTVIRPNPEEHLKVLTDIGAVTSTDQAATGPSVGVMTHPFPIHPAHNEGRQLQFAIAYVNENGFFNNAGGLLGVDSLGEPTGGLNKVDDYYNFRFLFQEGMAPATKQEYRDSITLQSEEMLSTAIFGLSTRGGTFTGGTIANTLTTNFLGAGDQMENQECLLSAPGGISIHSRVFRAFENVVGEDFPQVTYPLFKQYLNSANPDTGASHFPFFAEGVPNPNGHVQNPGPIFSLIGGVGYDGSDWVSSWEENTQNEFGDLWYSYYSGTSGNFAADVVSDVTLQNQNALTYFDPSNLLGANMSFAEAFNNANFNEYLGDNHPINKAYHRGGLFSRTNVVGSGSNMTTVSNYWGLGDDPEGAMFEYIHNGRIALNENNLYRPSGPGRFVVQPHNFKVGDIVILKGHGNTRNPRYYGQYKEKNIAGDEYISFDREYDINQDIVFNDFWNYTGDWNTGNTGGQNIGNDGGNTRIHDGFMDKVKARITKIEHVNMRAGSHVINANGEETEIAGGWKDMYGDEYANLEDRFIFLRQEFVGNLINDGTPIVEHNVDVDGNNVTVPPSFFSTPSYASQYIVTIEIIENNMKTLDDPSLRVDLSHEHLNGLTGNRIGHGNPTENAAMLPSHYGEQNSPYWNQDIGWGFVPTVTGGVQSYGGANNNLYDKYYGPPMAQVWSVSLASAVEPDALNLSDERALRESMLRFSYRYQYEDNEYSGLAPFTTVIWRTLNQKIDWPNYYISLLNEIKDLKLIDWRPKNLPQDVKAIELFVKSEEATNIYAIKKYDFRDPEYATPANGSYTGFHDFNANTLGLTLEPNQILRPFDSVPRAAKAQDVTANRVVYGNYLKDYSLLEQAPSFVDDFGALDYATIDTDIKVHLRVGLHNYINQIQGQITGADGNPINITIGSDEGAIESFEDAYEGVNPNFGIPLESIKSYRSYQLGIVYRDELGRETPVLTNKEAVVKVDPNQAKKTNRFTVEVTTPHPTWAKSYKFFVKDTSLDYHVLPLEEVRHFVSDDGVDGTSIEGINSQLTKGSQTLLIFSSDHRNKVQEGDILIQKRAHRISGPPDPTLTNVTNSFEPENLSLEYEVQKIRNEAPQLLLDALGGDDGSFDGKFFVYVKTDRPLIVNNNVGQLPGPNTAKTQGVFETRPKPNYDIDLYYEASQAYPIVLDDETDEQYIKVGRMVLPFQYSPLIGGVGGSLLANSIANPLDTYFPAMYSDDVDGDGTVTYFDEANFEPITVLEVSTNVGRHSINDALYTTVKLSAPVTLTVPAFPNELVIRIQEHRSERLNVGEYVFVVLAQSVVDSDTILVKRHTHNSNFSLVNNIITPIALPYYNCFCFGNGIEISTARNSFNGARIQKGVKASSIYEDYAEVKVGTGLIFSGIYNSYSGFNETNQFIEALGITKRFNPDHGDIQKLFARANDLIVLCEDKVLKVLSQKDAIFKADANPDLLATDRVLGQSVAFDGEYGISNNPESFAHYGFRSYFTDSKRGVVIRLSKDGMTIISDQGMDSYFKSHLSNIRGLDLENNPGTGKYIFGAYDIDKNEYLLSCERFSLLTVEDPIDEGVTVAWDESLNAWTSFRTYTTTGQGYSLKNQFFSPFTARIYHHENENAGQYGIHQGYHSGRPSSFHDPRVTVVYNEQPGVVKDFTYANYEGSQARIEQDYSDGYLSTNVNRSGWWISSVLSDLEQGMSINFKNKENKWHNYLMPKQFIGRQGPAIEFDFESLIVVGEPVGFETDTGVGGNSLRIKFLANNVLEPDDQFGANYINTGRVDLSQINPGWGIFLLRLPDGFEDGTEEASTVINPFSWESLGFVENPALNTDFGFSETHIDTTQLTDAQWAAITADPLFDGTYAPDINGPRYLIALAPLASEKAGGVKGYFARTVWRNNDYENKSELFATALNAIESSK